MTMSSQTAQESESAVNSTVASLDTTDSTRDADDDQQPVPDLDTDAIFHLLKNRRRRDVLRYLATNTGEVTIGAVAEHVAARENDIPVSQLTSQQRKRVYVALYQCHLPMMADYGVITFNRPRGLLELTPTAAQLEPYLNDTLTEQGQWSDYLTVTMFGGLLYLLGGLLVGFGSWFTTLTVVGLLVSVTVLALREGRDDIVEAVHDNVPDSLSRGLQSVLGGPLTDNEPVGNDSVADD